ncbi:MAG: tetratricopeptide repeat protein [Candidatus Wallbacteria bacterium]|nr:tetratricopeptide repeat protein [Candidatus Wallbacteria bacterium]
MRTARLRLACTPVLLVLALALGPAAWADTAQLHNTAGLAFYYQGDLRAAYDEFAKAVELDPNAVEPHYNLGRIYEKQARYKECLEQYREALSLQPDHQGSKEGLERMGYYITPQKIEPKFSDEKSRREAIARELKAVHDLRMSGQLDAALTRADEALKLFPNEARFELAAAAALETNGELNGAIVRLKQAERVIPSSGALQFHLAQDLFKVGLAEEGIVHANRAVELAPKEPKPYVLLADIYLSRGDNSMAFDRLFEASRLAPSDEPLGARVKALSKLLGLGHYTTGLYYFNQNNWKMARDELKLAIEAGNLTDEQRAIAQQYLIVSDFSLAKVADTIRKLQKDRDVVEKGFLAKRIGFEELIKSPNAFSAGTYVAFEGWIVSTTGAPVTEIVVTTDPGDVDGSRTRMGRDGISTDDLEFNIGIGAVAGGIDRGANARNPSIGQGQAGGRGPVVSPTATGIAAVDGLGAGRSIPLDLPDFRANSVMTRWFVARMPRPLPADSRIRPRSRIRVEGKLGPSGYLRNVYNSLFSKKPQPSVDVTFVSIQRENKGRLEQNSLRLPETDVNTPPGLAGPLRVDFLELSELQKKNR